MNENILDGQLNCEIDERCRSVAERSACLFNLIAFMNLFEVFTTGIFECQPRAVNISLSTVCILEEF